METILNFGENIQAWFARNLKGDPVLWGVAVFLLGSGVLVVYSASVMESYLEYNGDTEYLLYKQIQAAVMAFLVMYVVHRMPYTKFVVFSRLGVWVSVILLLFTFFKGVSVNDAARWVEIPLIKQRFQPSELAKVALDRAFGAGTGPALQDQLQHGIHGRAHFHDRLGLRLDLPFQYFYRCAAGSHLLHDDVCRQGTRKVPIVDAGYFPDHVWVS